MSDVKPQVERPAAVTPVRRPRSASASLSPEADADAHHVKRERHQSIGREEINQLAMALRAPLVEMPARPVPAWFAANALRHAEAAGPAPPRIVAAVPGPAQAAEPAPAPATAVVAPGVPAVEAVLAVEGEEEPHREVSLIYNDPTADFELISREGLSIRIHEFYLLANSPYFRRLKAQGTLVSPHHMPLDNSEAIEEWLSLVTRRPFAWQYDETLKYHIGRLVATCRRLECDYLVETITNILRREVNKPGRGGMKALKVFMIGAIALDDPELCRRAIAAVGGQKWEAVGATGSVLMLGVEGRSVLDITAMPASMLGDIPPRYLAGLGRAFKVWDPTKDQNLIWIDVAKEFYKLMRL